MILDAFSIRKGTSADDYEEIAICMNGRVALYIANLLTVAKERRYFVEPVKISSDTEIQIIGLDDE